MTTSESEIVHLYEPAVFYTERFDEIIIISVYEDNNSVIVEIEFDGHIIKNTDDDIKKESTLELRMLMAGVFVLKRALNSDLEYLGKL